MWTNVAGDTAMCRCFILAVILMPSGIMALITRAEWDAQPPKDVETFSSPSKFVVIHHSYIPPACNTTEQCKRAMRSMQEFHQVDRGWNDIGYSFAIGGDGQIYEGRGFNVIGAHAPRYNDKSVGICLIGDWRTELPPKSMLEAVNKLIQYGLSKGHIEPTYKLVGHRQVRDTECPGTALFEEISTWPNFDPTIGNPADNNEVPT